MPEQESSLKREDLFVELSECIRAGQLVRALELAMVLHLYTLASALRIEIDAKTYVAEQMQMFGEEWAKP